MIMSWVINVITVAGQHLERKYMDGLANPDLKARSCWNVTAQLTVQTEACSFFSDEMHVRKQFWYIYSAGESARHPGLALWNDVYFICYKIEGASSSVTDVAVVLWLPSSSKTYNSLFLATYQILFSIYFRFSYVGGIFICTQEFSSVGLPMKAMTCLVRTGDFIRYTMHTADSNQNTNLYSTAKKYLYIVTWRLKAGII
jgi:hypothetical protein